ncbi:MAG: AgmX/PglI C-terminal domain-containing protein, partial [Acidobacteriota bacterium]
LIAGVGVIAKMFFYIYATAHDDRYYQPAHDIYDLVIAATKSDAAREQPVKDKNELERWQKTYAMKGHELAGTHDKSAIGALLSRHNQEIQACYEVRLSANSKLAGTLVLNLESDQTGVIKGASTDPKAGMADLAAVAACAAEHAKAWRLPKTANGAGSHSTRIKLTYNLAPKKADEPKK